MSSDQTISKQAGIVSNAHDVELKLNRCWLNRIIDGSSFRLRCRRGCDAIGWNLVTIIAGRNKRLFALYVERTLYRDLVSKCSWRKSATDGPILRRQPPPTVDPNTTDTPRIEFAELENKSTDDVEPIQDFAHHPIVNSGTDHFALMACQPGQHVNDLKHWSIPLLSARNTSGG